MAEAQEEQGVAGEIWYVGFRPVPTRLPLPWRWFIHPNFAHVMAFRFDITANAWVFTEWSGVKLHIEIWKGRDMDDISAAVTPYQLFCTLRKRGGTVIYDAGDK